MFTFFWQRSPAEQLAFAEKHLAGGFIRGVIRLGLLRFGVPMFLVFTLGSYVLPWLHHPNPITIGWVAMQLGLWSSCGVILGVLHWSQLSGQVMQLRGKVKVAEALAKE